MFLNCTVSTLKPIVGMVVTTSPICSRYRMVVFPLQSQSESVPTVSSGTQAPPPSATLRAASQTPRIPSRQLHASCRASRAIQPKRQVVDKVEEQRRGEGAALFDAWWRAKNRTTYAESSPSINIRTSVCREKRPDTFEKREENETPCRRGGSPGSESGQQRRVGGTPVKGEGGESRRVGRGRGREQGKFSLP